LDLLRVDEPQPPVGSDHDAVEQVELRHLEHVLQGADLVAAAAEHGRAGRGAFVGDGRVIVMPARASAAALASAVGVAPAASVASADVLHAAPAFPPLSVEYRWSPP